jgi:hypothetical protein
MSVDRKKQATDVEDANLSRRSFLVRLTMIGIGSAIAMSMSANAAHAAADSEIASGAKDLTNSESWPESNMAEVVQPVDPNDPLQHFNQPYYRHRRRVARRVYRRGRRVVRRTYRRARRYYYY